MIFTKQKAKNSLITINESILELQKINIEGTKAILNNESKVVTIVENGLNGV